MNDNIIYKKVLLFLSILILINSGISILYYKRWVKKDAYFRADVAYKKEKKSVHTLIMGHSRAFFGIDAKQIEGSFNYASYGENNVYTYYKLKKLLADPDHRIKRIIIPVGYSSFCSNTTPDGMDHSYWKRYVNYIELGISHQDLSNYLSVYTQSLLFPYTKYLVTRINKQGFNFKERKNRLTDLKTEVEKYNYVDQALTHHYYERSYYDDISYDYLIRFLELCKEQKIHVIGIKFPITPYYEKAFLSRTGNVNALNQRFMDALEEFNVTVFDEQFHFTTEDVFKDGHHLNQKGKHEFTAYLKEQLLNELK